MKTFAAPPSNVLFNLPFDLDVADATSAFLAYQHFGATNCPAAMSMEIDMGAGSKFGSSVISKSPGRLMGSLEEYKKAIAPLLKDLPTKADQTDRQGICLGPQFGSLGRGQIVEYDGCQRQRELPLPMLNFFGYL